MIQLKELLKAIEQAETYDEITEAKEKFGYTELVQKVQEVARKKSNYIRKERELQARKERFDNRKNLLKRNVGEIIYYIGADYKEIYKNRPCRLLKVNRTKCLVRFKEKTGDWNIPIMELYSEQTTIKPFFL